MNHSDILDNTTFGVNSTGNTQALLMCLTSVVNQHQLPKTVNVRLEGEFPSFANFYLEQLAALFRHQGIEFNMSVGKSEGVRKARDWQLDHCLTPYLWMGDDDVIYHAGCLAWLDRAREEVMTARFREGLEEGEFGYIQGSKPDVINRRGYGDFSTKVFESENLAGHVSFNQFYAGKHSIVRVNTLDTGNVLLNVTAMRKEKLRFDVFEHGFNAGGEDTLMGMRMNQLDLFGFFCTQAKSVHLEKPNPVFNEFAARGEAIMRSAELLRVDIAPMTEFMPFLKRK